MFDSNKANDIEKKKLSDKITFMLGWFGKRVDFNIT